jgi:hypothetical protein
MPDMVEREVITKIVSRFNIQAVGGRRVLVDDLTSMYFPGPDPIRDFKDWIESSKSISAQDGDQAPLPVEKPGPSEGKIKIRNVKQAVVQSAAAIAAIEEVLILEESRYHNAPPSGLRVDSDYLAHLRDLVNELRRLNLALEELRTTSRTPKNLDQHVILTRKHINTFLNQFSTSFAKSAGVGAGMAVSALLFTLLFQLGMPETVFDVLLKKIH